MARTDAPRRFAEDTNVPVSKSRAEVEDLVRKYGADQFFSAWQEGGALVGFRLAGRVIRIALPLPAELGEQGERARWRALVLVLKAKLVAVAEGLTSVEREFLADLVLPDNSTVGDRTLPQITRAYETGETPNLLAGLLPGPVKP